MEDGPVAERTTRRRRWPWVALATVVGLAALSAGLWFVWFPHFRPDLHEGERYGIDVASHQGDIDWEQVPGDDIEFAYVKATEGGDFTDGRFAASWERAASVDLERGAYHFFTLCTPGAEQAEHFLRTVPADDPGELPPALDLELAGNCRERPPEEDVRAEVEAFIALVEAERGREVLLYVGDDWEDRYPVRDELDRPIWHRRWVQRPETEDWVVWQASGRAEVAGIEGPVDLDVARPGWPPG